MQAACKRWVPLKREKETYLILEVAPVSNDPGIPVIHLQLTSRKRLGKGRFSEINVWLYAKAEGFSFINTETSSWSIRTKWVEQT